MMGARSSCNQGARSHLLVPAPVEPSLWRPAEPGLKGEAGLLPPPPLLPLLLLLGECTAPEPCLSAH
jgi:hypothetical protein